MNNNRLATLPQIETLLQDPNIQPYITSVSRPLVTTVARNTIESIRQSVLKDSVEVPSADIIITLFEDALKQIQREKLQKVINATGVIIHTNMGRSPLPVKVWQEAQDINCGHSNLELNLHSGRRGMRKGLIPQLLSTLLKCEDALIVNNNAAAVLLVLQTFAKKKEVIVSRGEQVQIGGGFRIPEILEQSGATLVEVGTTNITTIEDYSTALSENTAMMLAVHRSNFAIRGFTQSASVRELANIKPQNVMLCVDQGSGVIDESLPGEISVKSHIANGADLVCFSGDKVFGGPQAGIIVGKKEYIAKLEHHPLMRVFRPGKTVYSLLESLLIRKMNGTSSIIAERLAFTPDGLRARGKKIIKTMDKQRISIVDSICTTGGGTAPDENFPSLSLRLELNEHPEKILSVLREAQPPIIGTIIDDRVQLNLATIGDDEISHVTSTLHHLLGE